MHAQWWREGIIKNSDHVFSFMMKTACFHAVHAWFKQRAIIQSIALSWGNGLHNHLHGRRAFEEINSCRRGGISIQEQTATDHPGDLDVHLLCFRPCCVENAKLHAGYGHSRCRDPYVVCSVLPSRPSGSMLPEYRRGDVLLIDNRFPCDSDCRHCGLQHSLKKHSHCSPRACHTQSVFAMMNVWLLEERRRNRASWRRETTTRFTTSNCTNRVPFYCVFSRCRPILPESR